MVKVELIRVGNLRVVRAASHPLVAWNVTLSAMTPSGEVVAAQGGGSHQEAWRKLAGDIGISPTPTPQAIIDADAPGVA